MITTKLLDKLAARNDAIHDIVDTIKSVSKTYPKSYSREALALAHRIHLCGSPANTFLARDATNFTTGELFDAIGTYWSCGSKLCPNCLARFSRENRKKLREALSHQKLRSGEKYYFATFTIPNNDLGIIASRTLMDDIWARFRKRLLCVSLIRGGCKSEEFTVTTTGVHYHHHHVWVSRWMSYQEIRRVWTECASAVFADAHVPFNVPTKDGLLIVKIKPVVKLETLVHELCKYMTKSDSWRKLDPRHLMEACLIRRWPRMFELYGDFAPRNTRPAISADPTASEAAIVHTTPLTDGSASHNSESWRDQLAHMQLPDYIDWLELEFSQTVRLRKHQLQQKWAYATLVSVSELTEPSASDDITLHPNAEWLRDMIREQRAKNSREIQSK